jgi:hypothetical protein
VALSLRLEGGDRGLEGADRRQLGFGGGTGDF